MALPEVHSEVLVLRGAAQPVVPQPQVLQLRRGLRAQLLQISHSVAAELQDLPRTEGTTNTLCNEQLLAHPRAAQLVQCSHMGSLSDPTVTRLCSPTFSVRGRLAEVTLLIWLAQSISSSRCCNCSRSSSTSSTYEELCLATVTLNHLVSCGSR